MRTKMVSTTLSEEMTKAKIPKGNGSKACTPGIRLRLIALQVSTRRTCNSKNAVLPIILVIAFARSFGRSAAQQRLVLQLGDSFDIAISGIGRLVAGWAHHCHS